MGKVPHDQICLNDLQLTQPSLHWFLKTVLHNSNSDLSLFRETSEASENPEGKRKKEESKIENETQEPSEPLETYYSLDEAEAKRLEEFVERFLKEHPELSAETDPKSGHETLREQSKPVSETDTALEKPLEEPGKDFELEHADQTVEEKRREAVAETLKPISKENREKQDLLGEEPEAHASFRPLESPLNIPKESAREEDSERLTPPKGAFLETRPEGLFIKLGEFEYKIGHTETQLVCGEEVGRYTGEDGGVFTQWTKHEKLNPPWKTSWYELSDRQVLYVTDLGETIEEAVKRSGGQKGLAERMSGLGVDTSQHAIWRMVHDTHESIEVENLRAIATYLERDYDSFNERIRALVSGESLGSPKIPFNLNSIEGATLCSATLSDGGIRSDRYLFYTNKKPESRKRIIETAKKVFGDVNVYEHGYNIFFTSRITGDVMEKAGIPVGETADKDPHIPTFILQGRRELRRAYLSQAYSDEGHVTKRSQRGITYPRIALKRSRDISKLLTDRDSELLESTVTWKKRMLPRNQEQLYANYTRKLRKKLEAKLVEIVEDNPPHLISEEKQILEGFGISPNLKPYEIYKTQRGYSASWISIIERYHDLVKFRDEIGFFDSEKQGRLEKILKESEETKMRVRRL